MRPGATRWRDELGIAALLAAAALAIAFSGWAWRLDRLVYDLGLTLWQRPPPADIVIVAIDDASVQAIGRWPWRRAVHATLLERIAAARPKAVALDLVLSEADADPAEDRLLAAAMVKAAPLVLPVAGLLPDPALRGSALLGSSEPAVDPDGVLRHAFLSAGPAGAPLPHLGLVLLAAGGEAVHPSLHALADTALPSPAGWRRDGEFLVRYVGPPGSVERLSYVDVLSGRVAAERLAGRYVLIGMTAEGLGDTLATPVNARHQAMPGVEVLANILYTLRSGDTLRPLGAAPLAAASAGLVALLVLSLGGVGARAALPLALAAVPLAVAASLLALLGGWWISPVPFALAALPAYPLWSWRRLERAVAGLDREIARLAAQPLVAGISGAAAPSPRYQGSDRIVFRLRTLRSVGAGLQLAQRFMADTLAAMPTAMLVADGSLRVMLANPRAAALFEVDDATEMQGLDLPRLLGEFDTPAATAWPAVLAALPPGGEGLAVEAQRAGCGDVVIHVASVDLQGERRFVVTLTDLAPVKEAERAREEVLAFVSHDLRSPASAIVLLADLQLQGDTPPAAPETLLREVRRLAARTLALSEDFVHAAQAQTRPLQAASTPLPALIDDALADLRPQAEAAGVTLAPQADEGEVVLDALLVRRAIANLVSNAIKHSPRNAAVDVRATAQAGWLRISVRDRGRGLTPAQLTQLAQGNAGASVTDARGIGLGLLFVQRVARRHGGQLLAAAPADGPGALFSLELPV